MISINMARKAVKEIYKGDKFEFFVFFQSPDTIHGQHLVTGATEITVILQGVPNQTLTLSGGDIITAAGETNGVGNSIKCTVSVEKSLLLKEGENVITCVTVIAGTRLTFETKATFKVVAPTVIV